MQTVDTGVAEPSDVPVASGQFGEEKRLLLEAAASTRRDRQGIEAFRRQLERASEHVRGDPQAMLEILSNFPRPWVIDYASDELRNSRDFMLAAMECYPEAMQHAGEELSSDRGLVLETLRRLQQLAEQGEGLSKHALSLSATCWCHNDQLRSDRDVVTEAMKISAENLWEANREIKEDKDFVLLAYRQSEEPTVIRRQALVLPCSWHEFRAACDSFLACRGEDAPVVSLTLQQEHGRAGVQCEAILLSGTVFHCFVHDDETHRFCINDLAKRVLEALPKRPEAPSSRVFLLLKKPGTDEEVALTAWDWSRRLAEYL